MDEREKSLVLKVGHLIRGDWSGTFFDGRDVLRWLQRIVDGDRLDELEKELDVFNDGP